MRTNLSFVLLAIITLITSCTRNNLKRDGVWVPIYKNKSEVQQITNLQPQTVRAGGKVYAYRDFVFQLEQNQGIHIYRLEQKKPIPFGFIQVFGAQEISIKDSYLYTNNYSDIVVMNIADPNNAQLISRVNNAFKLNTAELPPEKGYFQCVDSTKGVIVGWEKQNNIEANCMY